MNHADKISALHRKYGGQVQVRRTHKFLGFIPIVRLGWWLWLEEGEGYWRVFRASDKDYHCRAGGTPALAADFLKSTGERRVGPVDLQGAWDSAVTMWPITNEAKAKEIFDTIASEVDAAYDHYFGTEVEPAKAA